MHINVTIEGVAPLLMNCFTGEIERNGTPHEQAAKKAYRNNDTDELEFPCQNIMACLIEAGDNFFSTSESERIPTSLQVLGITIPLGTKDFKVDSRSVICRSTGERVMCHRPRIDEWQLSFKIFADDAIFSMNLVRELFEHAGLVVGLGDYRPGRRGPFGRFVVKKFQKINENEELPQAA